MSYAAVTLVTLRTRLQDRYEDMPFWTDAEANDAINEALRQFNMYTGFWRGSATVVTVAGEYFLAVPAALTYRSRVTRSGKVLTRKSILELYRYRRNWRTQSTTTGGEVPSGIVEWAPIGLGTIAIWPADAAGGTTLTVEAVKLTPTLSADGDFLDLGEEEIGPLLDESLWILSFKRPSEFEGMKPRHLSFMTACLAKNDKLRASSYFRAMLGLDQEQRLFKTTVEKTPTNAEAGED